MATDWDKELAKIDKQLASVSDEELARAATAPPARSGSAPPRAVATGAPVATPPRATRGWAVWLRILAAVGIGAAVLLWPYPKSCGMQLVGYLGATGVTTLAGIWASVWSWRHRTAIGHVAGLAVMGTGLTLAALEVLPRIGYAYPSADHPSNWSCSTPNVTGGASTTPSGPPVSPQVAPQAAPQVAPQQAPPPQVAPPQTVPSQGALQPAPQGATQPAAPQPAVSQPAPPAPR